MLLGMSENLSILPDLVVIFAMATIVVIFFHRANLPPIVGFLITGILCGSHVFNIIEDEENVKKLGEIGMILLLFSLGIELSFKKILDLGKFLLIGGLLQVVLTVILVSLISGAYGYPVSKSIFLGMLISLSSTALVVRYMADRGEISSLHGKASFSILIFQDLIIVPMVMVTPFLGTDSSISINDILIKLALAIAFIIAAIVATRFVVPWILHQVVKTRNREAFLMTLMLLCAATVWATGELELSATLGAFIAGLVISESDYSLQAFSEILPLREIFNSLFFVSVGMLFDPAIVLNNPLIVLSCIAGIIALKLFVTSMVTFFYGYSLRVAMLTGLALAQIGEFSFVLAEVGRSHDIITKDNQSLFLALAIGTMLATPAVRFAWTPLASTLNRLFPNSWSQGYLLTEIDQKVSDIKDHVIVIGFGPNGRQLVDVLIEVEIPYLILEMNPDTVRKQHKIGRRILYGDAARPEVLNKAHLKNAKMVVITIPDMSAARRIVHMVKIANPHIHILVRTAYYNDLPEFKKLGAHEVISQEFETSIKIFSHALEFCEVPKQRVDDFVLELRTAHNTLIEEEQL